MTTDDIYPLEHQESAICIVLEESWEDFYDMYATRDALLLNLVIMETFRCFRGFKREGYPSKVSPLIKEALETWE